MDKKSFESLVGKAMTDKSFRERLLRDPEETLRQENFPADTYLINAIKRISARDAETAVEEFEKRLASSTTNSAA